MEQTFKEKLLKKSPELTEEMQQQFEDYMNLLLEWNEKINLTAITEEDDIILKHFVDSLTISKYIEQGKAVVDVGTGAGFPGIPLKIERKDLKITLVDSLNKRINFLKEVSSNLNFEKSEFVHMRAEDAGKDKKFRGKYDYAVSRAVAPLKVLSEYCIPLLKIGGTFAAFKAFDIEEELNDAKSMIGNLGGKIKDIKEVKIPHSDIVRKIVLIEKIKETQKEFPRKANKIK